METKNPFMPKGTIIIRSISVYNFLLIQYHILAYSPDLFYYLTLVFLRRDRKKLTFVGERILDAYHVRITLGVYRKTGESLAYSYAPHRLVPGVSGP